MKNSTLDAIRDARRALLENASADTVAVAREAQNLAALAWLVDAFHFYRQLGFFADTPDLSDGNLAQRYIERNDWFDPFAPLEPQHETMFLMQDTTRVWASDWECDVCAGNLSYTGLLGQLKAISRGLFAPENIVEVWDETAIEREYHNDIKVQEGKIQVSFNCNGQPFYFEPGYCADWLDVGSPLQAANEALRPSGYQFEQLEFDSIIGVVLLSAPEKQRLRSERDLKLITLPDDNFKYRGTDADEFDIADPFAEE